MHYVPNDKWREELGLEIGQYCRNMRHQETNQERSSCNHVVSTRLGDWLILRAIKASAHRAGSVLFLFEVGDI